MDHETLSKFIQDSGRFVRRRLRAVVPPESLRAVRPTPADAPVDPSARPEPVRVGTGCIRPFEDESSADFFERVARIKADLLSRALTAPEELRAARAAAAARATARADSSDWTSPEIGRHPWSVERRTATGDASDQAAADPAPRSEIARAARQVAAARRSHLQSGPRSRPTQPRRRAAPEPSDRANDVLDRVFGVGPR